MMTWLYRLLEGLGRPVVQRYLYLVDLFGLIAASVWMPLHRSYWTYPVRTVFMRQLYFTAVLGTTVAVRTGAAVGIMVVVQTELWGGMVGGGTDLLESVMLQVSLRELAPLLANLILIGRSGSAIATEMAHMSLSGEIELLDAQGVDPMKYLVIPRVLGTAISTFCLAIVIIWTMLGVGFLVGQFLGVTTGSPSYFFLSLAENITREDAIFFLPKTLGSGALVGAICCVEGLSVRQTATELPVVASRSSVMALTAVLATAAILSLVIYGKLLFINIFDPFA